MNEQSVLFEGVHAYTLQEKGVLVIGQMPDPQLQVGDRLIFTNAKGKHRRTTVRAVVLKPKLQTPKETETVSGQVGIVIDEVDRAEIKLPVVLSLERRGRRRRLVGDASDAGPVS